jgi:ribokinase
MDSQKKPIVVVGSINMDFVVKAPEIPRPGETLTGTEFQTHFGGKGANQAVAIARLGYPVAMIGMVGSDTHGEQLKSSLKDVGVGIDAVSTVEGSSGVASITVSASGENAIVVVAGANARVSPDYLDRHEETIKNAGMILAQLEIPIETIARLAELCERHRVPLILDPAPAQNLPHQTFAKIDWITPNQTESAFYAGQDSSASLLTPEQSAARLLARGCRGVVLKMGARGVYVAPSEGAAAFVPAFAVKAVDSVAAGDAFNGGFATALMRGESPFESARFGAAVAALSVTRAGAQTAMPSMEEVERFRKLMTNHANEIPA